MDRCVLIKPDFSYENDIQLFRKEMLDANSSMDGTGPLKRMENIKDWLEFNQRCENEGSKRTILATNGVYESTIYCEPDNVYLERYWIH